MTPSTLPSALIQSYLLFTTVVVLKLVTLTLLTLVCCSEKVQPVHISDLKNLKTFWLVATLYMMTSPNEQTAIALLRTYTTARSVVALGYIMKLPKVLIESAFLVSLLITCFMGGWVVLTYQVAIK